LRAPDDDVISIMFGDEQLTLDFHDVASLYRLRDVAEEAARVLRAILEPSSPSCFTSRSDVIART
jgi:hypothetical protein